MAIVTCGVMVIDIVFSMIWPATIIELLCSILGIIIFGIIIGALAVKKEKAQTVAKILLYVALVLVLLKAYITYILYAHWTLMVLDLCYIAIWFVAFLLLPPLKKGASKALFKGRNGGTYDSENQIEELKNLKALLDNGAITQEEFETKKKQILGL